MYQTVNFAKFEWDKNPAEAKKIQAASQIVGHQLHCLRVMSHKTMWKKLKYGVLYCTYDEYPLILRFDLKSSEVVYMDTKFSQVREGEMMIFLNQVKRHSGKAPLKIKSVACYQPSTAEEAKYLGLYNLMNLTGFRTKAVIRDQGIMMYQAEWYFTRQRDPSLMLYVKNFISHVVVDHVSLESPIR